MNHVRGTFRVKISASHSSVRQYACVPMLAFHPELHSRTWFINSGDLIVGAC